MASPENTPLEESVLAVLGTLSDLEACTKNVFEGTEAVFHQRLYVVSAAGGNFLRMILPPVDCITSLEMIW
jgi:hypothetical protein